jgi:hypothetical protein
MINPNFIPPDNLLEKLNEKEFTCFICFGIVFKPRILNCCEYLVCLGCLNRIIIYKITYCPMCKSPISFSQPNKFIMRLFENLRLKCLSETEGCKKVLEYKKFFHHYLFECEYKKITKYSMMYCNICEELYFSSEKHICLNDRLEFNEPKYVEFFIYYSFIIF